MFSRRIPILIVFLLLSISVSRASLYPLGDEQLQSASELMKKREYSAAVTVALKARPGPLREFLIGVASYRMERWDEAERSLAETADAYPLLGDYSLYYRAVALSRLSRLDEALPLLQKLRKEYPDSPFLRSAALLGADIRFQKNDWRGALSAYGSYLEAYPSGNDSLKAMFRSALCRERLGDRDRAARELRGIWLGYPSGDFAAQAETELARLRSEGVEVQPYTGEELFRRGLVLFDRRKYREAAAALSSLPPGSLPEKLRGAHAFKTALALYRARKNKEAEQAFARLSSTESPYREFAPESYYWYAQTLDRVGRERDASAAFLKLADARPDSDLADDSLYHAALIRKQKGEHREALALFSRLLSEYPASPLASRALWETGWSRYLSGDLTGAADTFRRLSGDPTYRERALYWMGRSLEASGSADAARDAFDLLTEEYPAGYYALNREKAAGRGNGRVPCLSWTTLSTLPVPAGHDRTKALIALGLFEEARMELTATRKRSGSKPRNALDLAGLYLAMDDFNSAMALFKKESLKRQDRNSAYVWGILYPPAFRESVLRHASSNGISENLTFSLIRAESNFLPTARSPVGALGLMQLMPATAKATARHMREQVTPSRLCRPDLNIRIGTRHLRDLLASFNGNLVSAVAAYNAGSTPVLRWRKNLRSLSEDEFIENIPYPETREYVKKVLAGMEIYQRLYHGRKEALPVVATDSAPVQESYSSSPPRDSPALPIAEE